jgi:hypothetical protein
LATLDYDQPVDIANRALQHLGASRIVSFDDDSKNAAAVQFNYEKLRRAELRRNVWRFAIRRTAIRPIDVNTLLLAAPAWAAGTYQMADIVTHNDDTWISNGPTTGEPGVDTVWKPYFGPTTVMQWTAGTPTNTAYFTGELVYVAGSPHAIYFSAINGNAGTPGVDAAWVPINCDTSTLTFLYPVQAGPVSQSTTRNVYMLPNNFLRVAPQNPKGGSSSFLGSPSGDAYSDWEYESSFIVTRDADPIILRFVANVTNVQIMDSMFCEGLAARIAIETCEEITQSSEKLQACVALYKQFMGEAREVNSIETGSDEPALDDYITARI